MDNPEKLAILGTQNTGRRQTKHITTTQKTKEMRNTNTTKNTTQKTRDSVQCNMTYF
jgi:hypothetical protein